MQKQIISELQVLEKVIPLHEGMDFTFDLTYKKPGRNRRISLWMPTLLVCLIKINQILQKLFPQPFST